MVLDKSKKEAHVVIFLLILLAGFAMLDLGFAAPSVNNTRMTIFITNTAPTITFANVTPNPAVPGQTLTFRANFSDRNGDAFNATVVFYNSTHKAQNAPYVLGIIGKYYTNSTFQLPAGADAGTWHANVSVTDGFITIHNESGFEVNAVTSTKLHNTPIDFGNQTVGTKAQRAQNGTAVVGKYREIIGGFPLIINNSGNTINNYSINGSDLVGPSKTIGAGNVTWNITTTGISIGTRVGKIALTDTLKTIAINKAAGTTQNVYFWIDVPNGTTQQRLNGTVTITTAAE